MPTPTRDATARTYPRGFGLLPGTGGSCRASLLKIAGLAPANTQEVVSVTNTIVNDQTWYNTARTQKPQTFKGGAEGVVDPFSDPDTQCDFCRWKEMTASDTFGRVETQHCVSGSNLFKYCEPCHGIILFKHHDPLAFTGEHVAEMLAVSEEWFARAHAQHPDARYPLFIWNCLSRAGASQFHGHAQVMLSKVPFPAVARWQQAASKYRLTYPDTSLHRDTMHAYGAIGLLNLCGPAHDRVLVFPSIAPIKDMEIVVTGPSIGSATFAAALHGALRTLVEDFGACTFNVGIYNIAPSSWPTSDPAAASYDNGELESVMARYPFHAFVIAVSGVLTVLAMRIPGADCRIVARGKLSSAASDFGGLEVFGNASIGHTDPYAIQSALAPRLQQLVVPLCLDEL